MSLGAPPMLPEPMYDALAIAGMGNLTIELTKEHKRRLAALAVPGATWSPESKAYVVINPSPRAAAATIALFPEALIAHPELTTIRDSEYGSARPKDYATGLAL